MAEDTDDGACRKVILHAYSEMRQTTMPAEWAFEVAVKIYQYYHPKASNLTAENAVADYLAEQI